ASFLLAVGPLAAWRVVATTNRRVAGALTCAFALALLAVPSLVHPLIRVANLLVSPDSVFEGQQYRDFGQAIASIWWWVLVPLAFHAAVRSSLPSPAVVLGATLLGLHWGTTRFEKSTGTFYHLHHRTDDRVFV